MTNKKEDNYNILTLRGNTDSNLFFKVGIERGLNEPLFYNREKDDEIDNKNLFGYELFENTDLNLADVEEIFLRSSRIEKEKKEREKREIEKISHIEKFITKKILDKTPFPKPEISVIKNLNIISVPNDNYGLLSDTVQTVQSKQELLKQIMAMNFYNEKSEKKFSNTFHSQRPKSTETSRIHYGERLYHKGLALKEKSSKNLSSVRAHTRSKEMRECTFSPKLNHTTILCNLKATYSFGNDKYKKRPKIISFLSKDSYTNLNSQLSSNMLNKTQTLNKTTEVYDKIPNRFGKITTVTPSLKDSKFTTTTPVDYRQYESSKIKISKTTEELIQHSQRLYNDADKIRINKEKMVCDYYNENFPFQPSIADKNKPNVYNFFFRLQKWVDKRNEKYENDLEKINYDTKTGLRLFSPQIMTKESLSKQFGLSESNRSKCLELYQEWKRREAKGQETLESVKNEEEYMFNLSHTDAKSREISNELIGRIFLIIFEILVDRKSNVIDGNNMDLTLLPDKIIGMLTPLLNELKDQNETLTLNEFHLASKHLYNYLPYDEKLYLMDWYNSKTKIKKQIDDSDRFTFKPSINKNSEKIANRSSKYASNFYLRAIDELKNKEIKLKEESEKRKLNDNYNYNSHRPLTSNNQKNIYKHNYTYENSNNPNSLGSGRSTRMENRGFMTQRCNE